MELTKALAIRIVDSERLEFSDYFGMMAKPQFGVDPRLNGLKPQLGQLSDLSRQNGFIAEVRVRRAVPQRQYLSKQSAGSGWVGPQLPRRLFHTLAECHRIDVDGR